MEQNEQGNLDPDSGNLRVSMLMGELDKGVNSACDTISLVDEIVPAQKIVNEIAGVSDSEAVSLVSASRRIGL